MAAVKRNKKQKQTLTFRNEKAKLRKEADLRRRKVLIGRLKVIALLAGGAMVIIGLILTCIFLVFRVSGISIIGDVPYSAEDIVRVSGIENGDSLLMISSSAVEKKICSTMPYIEEVKVHKRISGTVELQITSASVFSSVESGGLYVYLSRGGRILQLADAANENSILVVGMELESPAPLGELKSVEAKKLGIYNEIIDAAEKMERLSDITQIDILDIYNIRVYYQNRILLNLGNASDIEYKLGMGLGDEFINSLSAGETGSLNLSDYKTNNKATYTSGNMTALEMPATDEGTGETPPPADSVQSDEDSSVETSDAGTESDNTENSDAGDGVDGNTDGGDESTDDAGGYTDTGDDYVDGGDGNTDGDGYYTDTGDGDAAGEGDTGGGDETYGGDELYADYDGENP